MWPFKPRPRSNVRVLFILKKHEVYGSMSYTGKASGLRHSAEFVSDMLNLNGMTSKVVIVDDNNDIDREVSVFKPDVVIIEALWVVPEKFDILKKLHPTVLWIVRVHSELPFLASEGIAIDWLRGYVFRDVLVAPNSQKTFEDFQALDLSPVYLPNFYPNNALKQKTFRQVPGQLHVGCFGAIRPLKNQLSQAVAAIRYADLKRLDLTFYINSTRVEDNASSILKNLRSLFSEGPHKLVEHGWQDHPAFLLLLDEMDLSLSVSFSETFSIITADAVSRQVPVVTSPEVVWADSAIQANPTDTEDITQKMQTALNGSVKKSLTGLRKFSTVSESIWLNFLEETL